MPQYGYLVVEGPHDTEFAARLLGPYGLHRVREFDLLDSFWHPLVPRNFPVDNDLLKRVPVPTFFQSLDSRYSIAIHNAGSCSRLVETVEESLTIIRRNELVGIGFFVDADAAVPETRYDRLKTDLSLIKEKLSLPDQPGQVQMDSPRCGVFILPNNSSTGTLEDILIECAQKNYDDLLNDATEYVNKFDQTVLTKEDLEEYKKPAGRNKAIVASIVSILKPGKSTQVSIQDNRWIAHETLELPNIKAAQSFLTTLLNIPNS